MDLTAMLIGLGLLAVCCWIEIPLGVIVPMVGLIMAFENAKVSVDNWERERDAQARDDR